MTTASTSQTAPTNGATHSPQLGVRFLALGDIDENPLNPRKTFLEIDELAKDVAQHGVLQPICVRPKGKRFELVFGARRYRAAQKAKLDAIPAMVHELDDAKALELMLVENSSRSDVHPMEEAEALEQLHTTYMLAVDDIAAKVGKSRSYVFGRMKLLALVPEARKAFYDGRLTPSTALYVARVPEPLQLEALNQLEEEAEEAYMGPIGKDGKPDQPPEPIPAREAARILRDKFMLRLADAPFDRGDAELVPDAGACKDCPKRSGAQPELFGDVPSADVCTDPICFGQKRDAAAAKARAKLEAKGVTVVDGKREAYGGVRPPAGYVRPDEFCPEAGKTFGELTKPAKVQKKLDDFGRVVMLDDKGKAVTLVKKADAMAAAGVKERKSSPGYKPPTPEQQAAEKLKRDAEDLAEQRAAARIVEKVESAGTLSDRVARIVCAAVAPRGIDMQSVAERRGWKVKQGWDADYGAEFAKLKGAALLGLLVELALTTRGVEDEMREACSLFGVDLKALKQEALAELKAKATPAAAPPAAKASKKAAKKAQKKS